MKLYRLDFFSADDGRLLSWHGSRAAAKRALRKQQEDRGEKGDAGPTGIAAVSIPTDKVGLLSWLNAHFDSDNG